MALPPDDDPDFDPALEPDFDESPPDEKQPPAELFPFDEMSTGAASALLKRARLVTGLQDDEPALEVESSLKPTTGRFLALKAAADSARATAPRAHAPPRPAAPPGPAARPTGPAVARPTGPAARPTGPAARPAGPVPPPRPRPSVGTQSPVALRSEIRSRLRHDAAVAPPPGVRPSRPVKPPLAAEDTFVKKKIRQAENNLPDWEFDDDDDDLV